jgi:hypothetical protein
VLHIYSEHVQAVASSNSQLLQVHGEFCSWCPEHRNDVSRCCTWIQVPAETTLAELARVNGISTKDLCRLNPTSDVPNQHGARGDGRFLADTLAGMHWLLHQVMPL